jgi:hypothetical protein
MGRKRRERERGSIKGERERKKGRVEKRKQEANSYRVEVEDDIHLGRVDSKNWWSKSI